MELKELKAKVAAVPLAVQIAPWTLTGGWIIMAIYWLNAFPLSSTIKNYLLVSKVERDAAQTGSALEKTLQSIQITSAILEPLKFVGITFIIVGISLFLIAILQTLKLRGEATRLALTAQKTK